MKSFKKLISIIMMSILFQQAASASVMYVCQKSPSNNADDNPWASSGYLISSYQCPSHRLVATFLDVESVNAVKSGLEEKITQSGDQVQQLIDQMVASADEKIAQAENKISQSQTELISAMESIPQRVLTEEVMRALKNQVVAEVLEQLGKEKKE